MLWFEIRFSTIKIKKGNTGATDTKMGNSWIKRKKIKDKNAGLGAVRVKPQPIIEIPTFVS